MDGADFFPPGYLNLATRPEAMFQNHYKTFPVRKTYVWSMSVIFAWTGWVDGFQKIKGKTFVFTKNHLCTFWRVISFFVWQSIKLRNVALGKVLPTCGIVFVVLDEVGDGVKEVFLRKVELLRRTRTLFNVVMFNDCFTITANTNTLLSTQHSPAICWVLRLMKISWVLKADQC